MTEQEYLRKYNAIVLSEAPFEVREQAVKKLKAKYNSNSVNIAKQQFMESQPDPIKGID